MTARSVLFALFPDLSQYIDSRSGYSPEVVRTDVQKVVYASFLKSLADGDDLVRANERVKHSTEDAFASTVSGYTTVMAENTNVRLSGGKVKYALYPVWLLNTTWNGNKYTFAMNGQTGKFVGDLPVDKSAAAKWTLLLTAIYGVAAYAVVWLLHLAGLF